MKGLYILGCGSNVNHCLGEDPQPNEFGFYKIDVPEYVEGIKQLLCGLTYSAFIDKDGYFYHWGQLSPNFPTNEKPTLCKFFANNGIKIKTGSCMNQHVAVITKDHQVYVWGDNKMGNLPTDQDINDEKPYRISLPSDLKPVSISCGGYFTLVLMSNGDVYSFGLNNENCLGTNNHNRIVTKPAKIFQLRNIIEISAGWSHSCALSMKNIIYSWGRSSYGRLGHSKDSSVAKVQTHDAGFHLISCSHTSTFAVNDNKGYYSCGWNQSGENGTGDKKIRRCLTHVDANFKVKDIRGAANSCFVLDENGKIYASGDNVDNVLGLGAHISEVSVMTQVPYLTNVKAIAAGNQHSLFAIEILK